MSVIGVFQHHLMCISRYVICVHLQMYLKSQNFYQLKTPFFPPKKGLQRAKVPKHPL